MPFFLVRQILQAYFDYDYFGLMSYGKLRAGKSSHAIQTLAETYGILENPDWKKMLNADWDSWVKWVTEETKPKWDAWKDWLVFEPRDWVRKVREENKVQRCLIVWDDAGFWLGHYNYKNPFIKAVSEYLNVAASDWACMLFTTPTPRWTMTHIRNLPGGHTGRVSKYTANIHQKDFRYMKVYEGWQTPDFKKEGVQAIFTDYFNVKLPNDLFKEYDEVRRGYAETAKIRMWETLDAIEKSWGRETAEKAREDMMKEAGLDGL